MRGDAAGLSSTTSAQAWQREGWWREDRRMDTVGGTWGDEDQAMLFLCLLSVP